MRVVLLEDVLSDKASEKPLDSIIHKIDDGFHEWDVEDPEVIEESVWFQGSRNFAKELFEKIRQAWGLSPVSRKPPRQASLRHI